MQICDVFVAVTVVVPKAPHIYMTSRSMSVHRVAGSMEGTELGGIELQRSS